MGIGGMFSADGGLLPVHCPGLSCGTHWDCVGPQCVAFAHKRIELLLQLRHLTRSGIASTSAWTRRANLRRTLLFFFQRETMDEESKLTHVSPYAQEHLQSATTSELEGVGPSAPRPPRCSSSDKAKDARTELHLRSQAWRALGVHA